MASSENIQTYPETTLRDFYSVVFRHLPKIILFFATVMVLTALGTFLGTKIYQSEAKVMVRLGRESVTLDPTASTGQIVNIGQTRDNEIKSELEILQSRILAEQVVDALGYQAFLQPAGFFDEVTGFITGLFAGAGEETSVKARDQVVRAVMKNLQIENQKNSNIIAITYKGKSPELTQAVVANLTDLYLDKHMKVYRVAGSDKFFAEQTELLRARLAQTEEALRQLKNQTGVASVSEQRSLLINRVGALQRELEQGEAALAASRSRVKAMAGTLDGLPKELVRLKSTGYAGNPIDYIQQKLHDLRLKEQDLLSQFTEKNSQVQEVRRQIAEAEGLLNKEGATKSQLNQMLLLTERASLSELQARAGAVKVDLATAKAELQRLNDNEVRLVRLEREKDILTANYRSYSEKLEQARINQALQTEKISNISVVQPATYPVKPIRPRKALNLALGFFLGTFGGLGLAFLSEYLDRSFKTPDEAEKILHLPVLATIPYFKDQSRAQFALGNPRGSLLPAAGFAAESQSRSRENDESLANHVLLALGNHNPQAALLAITSSVFGEGVSSTAAGLAAALARQGKGRVLLIDANQETPAVHHQFGARLAPGLGEIIGKGQADPAPIQASPVENLDLLTSGQGRVNFSLLLESPQFAELLRWWRTEYRLVIFDAPALGEATGAERLAGLVDGVILVVEAERTRREVVQRAQERLSQAQGNILGVVLNKRQFHIPERVYRTL